MGSLTHAANIWKSKLSKNIKIKILIAACESVQLYGSETWTLMKDQEKILEGIYTKMLQNVLMVLDVSWKDMASNVVLHGKLLKRSIKIRSNRLKLARHCVRRPEI